jgi:hypothetical protein
MRIEAGIHFLVEIDNVLAENGRLNGLICVDSDGEWYKKGATLVVIFLILIKRRLQRRPRNIQ